MGLSSCIKAVYIAKPLYSTPFSFPAVQSERSEIECLFVHSRKIGQEFFKVCWNT